MHKIFLLQALLLSSLLYGQAPNSAQSFDTYYQAPAFRDTGRIRKIRAAGPVVEKIYREFAIKAHFPAIAFGIIVDGQLVYAGSYGYTDLSTKTPASTQSLFRIASMSKSFTAMAILRLRDEGRLRLEDPAYNYIPELKNMPLLTADAPPITIYHLLTHSAGFPEDNPWGDRQLADPDTAIIQLIEKRISFSNAPGLQYEYSNLGFALLGRIITVITGRPYQQYITENILHPLGMEHTIWEYAQAPAGLLAHGYRWLNGQWNEEPLLHDGSFGAMGGLITSVEDFSRYMALHLSAWPPRNDAMEGPLKRSSIREMHQPHTFSDMNLTFSYPGGKSCPQVNAYGYGLRWTRDCEGRVIVGHSGGLPGFGSQWRILPDYGIGIVALANVTYAGLSNANWVVLDTLIALAGLKPRQLPISAILRQRQSELVRLLPDWKNARESGIFAVNFFEDHPLDSLKKVCKELYAKAGRIKKVHELMPENQLRGGFIIEGENGNIHVFFTLSPENPPLIQQLDLN